MEIQPVVWSGPEAVEAVRKSQPIILLECPIAGPKVPDFWSLRNLRQLIEPEFLCTVYTSHTKLVQYWDDDKVERCPYKFQPPGTHDRMTFAQFCTHSTSKNLYIRQSMVTEMGKAMIDAFSKFSFSTGVLFKQVGRWDKLTSNLLFCSRKGICTQVHNEEREILLVQQNGVQRVRLFPPSCWRGLYPYPFHHPADCYAQVHLPFTPLVPSSDEEFNQKFPLYNTIFESEQCAVLHPGEMLYIPQYWFYQVESITDNVSVAWTWEHRGMNRSNKQPVETIIIDESGILALRRNIG
jgi:hypoxia-inducible factor 1-alpha inhibitor (HIF hydroxylase)